MKREYVRYQPPIFDPKEQLPSNYYRSPFHQTIPITELFNVDEFKLKSQNKYMSFFMIKLRNEQYGMKQINLRYIQENFGTKQMQKIIYWQIWILKNLNSKYCVAYYGIILEKQFLRIFTQYCPGYSFRDSQNLKYQYKTLKDYLDNPSPNMYQIKSTKLINQSDKHTFRTLQFFIQILFALADLHSAQAAYFGLQPENILFSKDGCIKLSNFKNMNFIYQNKFKTPSTLFNQPLEMINSHSCQQICPLKHDVWSLGLILYRLLNVFSQRNQPYNIFTLKTSLDTFENKDQFKKIFAKQPYREGSKIISNEILSTLRIIAKKMLKKDKNQRISFLQLYSQQFDTILAAIRHVEDTEPTKLTRQYYNELVMMKSKYQQIEQTPDHGRKHHINFFNYYRSYKKLNYIQILQKYGRTNPQDNYQQILKHTYLLMKAVIYSYQQGKIQMLEGLQYRQEYIKYKQILNRIRINYHKIQGSQIY